MTYGWSRAPRSNATSTSSSTSAGRSRRRPCRPNCTVRVQSLTYMSSSHGKLQLDPALPQRVLDVGDQGVGHAGQAGAPVPPPPEVSPYSERH